METKTSLTLNKYKQPVIEEESAYALLLRGIPLSKCIFKANSKTEEYNSHAEEFDLPPLHLETSCDLGYTDFHLENSKTWDIPNKYKQIDVLQYCLDKCKTEKEIERVCEEIILFQERSLMPLLQASIYFVDYMRDNKYVWGVGRGSSVSSYCLFLIGIHKIDSIRYNLPIREFLK